MPQTLGVRRKYRLRRFLSSTAASILLLVLTVVLIRAAYRMYVRGQEAMAKRDAAQEELTRLEARKADLESEVSRLSTDRGVEEELRGRFLVAKDGERVAVVEEEKALAPTRKAEDDLSLWRKFLSAVGFSGE